MAEVLVTLAIIGFVAAMTIPNLLKNTNDAECISAFKKKFSEISQVFDQMRVENGGSLEGFFPSSTPSGLDSIITQYFNVLYKAGTQNSAGNTVWHDPNKWYYFNNTNITATCGGCAGYKLNDGAYMFINADNNITTCNDRGISGLCTLLYLDVNGSKKPNTMGKDIYVIYIYKNKTTPPDVAIPTDGIPSDDEITHCDASHLGYGCAKERLLH